MWEIGASACGRSYLPDNIFGEYNKAGIKYMEIAFRFPKKHEGITPDEEFRWYTSINTKSVVLQAEKHGINLWSMHLPFGHAYYNIASVNSDEREYTIKKHTEIIKKSSDLGVKYVVIHPSGESVLDEKREENMKIALDSLNRLSKCANEADIVLAVENLPRTCLGKNSEEIKKLLEADSSLRVCFDVNHLFNESHRDFVKNVGEKIVTLHISDYDFMDEKHWFPGEGGIDWKELIGLLKSINYCGPFMNEIACKISGEDSPLRTYAELYETNSKLLDKYF